ncbi:MULTISPECIES: GyrI-like domain-containing protein [Henriciella]|jgi:effector-binding domain-containing protein|uniref:GyrI-like domain-containing protein n=1 Tax=Henriciella TaxID=453849 RepID=UPI0035143F3D
MTIEKKTLPEQHYLYVERESEMGPQIAEAMGSGFGEVFGFVGQNGIQPQSMPMTLYTDMPEGSKMKFRAGVFVSPEDAGKASGSVKAATIPAGEAVTTTHVGPYANMNVSHKALWDHCDAEGYRKAMPVWEVYVDDPTTMPEEQVRTEIFRAVG